MAVFTEVKHTTDPEGEGRLATSAYFTFVATDESGKPREVLRKIAPSDPYEIRVQNAATARRKQRTDRIAQREMKVRDIHVHKEMKHGVDYVRLVLPDDTVIADTLFAGKLLFDLDQAASILALRFARGGVVTASVDAMDFYAPIFVGNALHIKVAVNHISKSSMEIGAKILGEDIARGTLSHCASAYLTFVHVDENGRALPLPERFEPESEAEKEHWQEAEARRELRLTRRKQREKTSS